MSLYDPDMEVGSRLEFVLTAVGSERKRQDLLKASGRFRFTCADPEMSHADRLAVMLEDVAVAWIEGLGQ